MARMGDRRGAYRVLMRKHNIRKQLERPWCRWEKNIKMDLPGIRRGCGMDVLVFVSEVMNFRVTQNAGNFLTSWLASQKRTLHGII